MSRKTLNLGILAHVDAGKTTLTERLLHAAGVIDEPGSVDDGTTRTDSLALEQQRGITIKSAVVSFAIGDVTVNLIDTPGHPDFIAEVERVLSVLDGAVLVISAVEGVQPQTRLLMRALLRLSVPTLLFVNKIDRRGAGYDRVLDAIRERLTPSIVAMGSVHHIGTRAAGFTEWGASDSVFASSLADELTAHDDALLSAYVNGAGVPSGRLRRELVAQSRKGLVHPVFFGSALTGAGVDALMAGIAEALPAAVGEADGPVSGTVFKVERGPAGEKIAYVRMFSGTVRVRDVVHFGRGVERKVTAIGVFEDGATVRRASAAAPQIAKLWGLAEIRIADAIGLPRDATEHHFAPPSLETVVVPGRREDHGRLHGALAQLAEQDPLIVVRQDDVRRELSLSLYGEVQKEVIQSTLATDHGIDVEFRETTTICIERPAGTGEAVERPGADDNPFLAGVGLRVEPAARGSGVEFRLEVELGAMPLAFFRAVEATVRDTLREGLHGWEVTDCTVTMTHSHYFPRQSHAHQGFSKAMSSTGADFRGLTPLVVMAALRRAGTDVYEPIHAFRLEIPAETLGSVLPVLAQLRAVARTSSVQGSSCVLEGAIPAARIHALRLQLPALSRGEGVLETAFDRHRRVRGPAPTRPRSDQNPLNREEYLLRAGRRLVGSPG